VWPPGDNDGPDSDLCFKYAGRLPSARVRLQALAAAKRLCSGLRTRVNYRDKGLPMKKLFPAAIVAAALVAPMLAPSGALAQERAGQAALGALSGAIVLGPVGAVAGAVIGYTAGPAIASSWGLRRSGRQYQRRY
jgi:hypothetical protein